MAQNSPRSNLPFWLWFAALLPMGGCGLILIAAFSLNLINTRQNTQPQVALTRTRAALTSRAISLTSAARSQYTAQARNQTATAILQNFSNASQYPLVFSDAFETPNIKWTASTSTLNQSEGKYKWQTKGLAVQTATVVVNANSKFYLTVEMRIVKDAPSADYGLLFHQTENEFYAFTINSAQLYKVTHYIGNQARPLLVARTRNNAIRPTEVNRLTVIGDGPNYALYINSQFVDQFTDTRLTGNGWGLMSQLITASNEAILEFDDFELRAAPDTGLPTATPNPTNTPDLYLSRTPTATRTPSPTRKP